MKLIPRLRFKENIGNWDNPSEYIDFKTVEDRDKCKEWIETLIKKAKIEGAEELFRMIDERGKSFKVDKWVGEILQEYRKKVLDR